MPNNPTINYPFILFLIQSTMELVKKKAHLFKFVHAMCSFVVLLLLSVYKSDQVILGNTKMYVCMLKRT
jgi:hypothetical protein